MGQAYWWWKDSYIDNQCWFVLRDHLHSLYAPHLLYASEQTIMLSKSPSFELGFRSFADICTELQEVLERYVASQAVKIETDPEPPVLIEPEVAAEPELTVIEEPEPEPEIEEPIVETSADLPAELAMELVSSSPAVRVLVS